MIRPSEFLISEKHRLQALPDSPRYFAPREQRADIERPYAASFSPSGTSRARSAARTLNDCRLADARLADQDRVFFVRRLRIWITRLISSSRRSRVELPLLGGLCQYRCRTCRAPGSALWILGGDALGRAPF